MFAALSNIASSKWRSHNYNEYFNIPENKKLFYDVILRNANININNEGVDIAFQFKEILENADISFQLSVEKIEKSLGHYGHREIDCENKTVTLEGGKLLRENVIVRNIYLNNEVLAINYQNI